MLYELRMYHLNEGRAPDAARRLSLMPPLFRAHGIPDPLAHWIASAGQDLPLYTWMLRWPDSAARAAAFASFYGDDRWMDVRDETNAGREMIRHFNIAFLAETPAHASARESLVAEPDESATRLHELRILRVMPGRQGQAMQTLIDTDMPALRRAGARTLGVFDVLSGFAGPSLVQFLSWQDAGARDDGLKAFEGDSAVTNARQRAISDKGNPYYRIDTTWLFQPTAFGVPAKAFDGPALT